MNQEDKQLITKWRDKKNLKARNELLTKYYYVVWHISNSLAVKYAKPVDDIFEMLQVAYVKSVDANTILNFRSFPHFLQTTLPRRYIDELRSQTNRSKINKRLEAYANENNCSLQDAELELGIAYRYCFDQHIKTSEIVNNNTKGDYENKLFDYEAPTVPPESHLIEQEIKSIINRQIVNYCKRRYSPSHVNKLSDRMIRVYQLYFVKGLTAKQIGKLFNLTEATIGNTLRTIKQDIIDITELSEYLT